MNTDPRSAADDGGLVPYLIVKGAARAIEFYARALGAQERFRLVDPASGKIGHAELCIGSSPFYLSDEYPDFGALRPPSVGGSQVKLHLRVADADAAIARAVDAGATVLRAVKTEFYGARTGMIADPFGHQWFLESQVEEVSPEEMQHRWNAMSS